MFQVQCYPVFSAISRGRPAAGVVFADSAAGQHAIGASKCRKKAEKTERRESTWSATRWPARNGHERQPKAAREECASRCSSLVRGSSPPLIRTIDRPGGGGDNRGKSPQLRAFVSTDSKRWPVQCADRLSAAALRAQEQTRREAWFRPCSARTARAAATAALCR